MRILLNDMLFPSLTAEWRLNEISSFINNFDTDIINLGEHNNKYEFNNYTREIFLLNEYDILINNPNYNYLNKYNKNFNGTLFNNKLLKCNFLYRKKKFRNINFDKNPWVLTNLCLNVYSKIYHIFYSNYKIYGIRYIYNTSNQIIHLYPGGGYIKDNIINTKNSKVVVSQHYILKDIINVNYNINILKLYGCSYYRKD